MAELQVDFDAVALMQQHRTEQIIDAFMTETLVTVRSRTPILTGTARAGWVRTPEGIVGLRDAASSIERRALYSET
jgi:hypothetical protein